MQRRIFAQEVKDPFWKPAIAIGGIVLALGIVGGIESEDKKVEDAQYCYQVALNKADPTQGWPDYEKKYKHLCSGTGLKSGL